MTLEVTLQPGGSGNGISHFTTYALCPARAEYDRAGIENLDRTGASVGFLYHVFLDAYRDPENDPTFDPSSVVLRDPEGEWAEIPEETRLEAERLFREYRDRFSPEALGRVLECETSYPRNQDEADAIHQEIGYGPRLVERFGNFTFRLDLRTKLLTQPAKSIRRLWASEATKKQAASLGPVVQPGTYITDYKTTKAHTGIMVSEQMDRLQYIAYQLGWAAVHGKALDGLLVDMCVKTRTPKFFLIPIPFPRRSEREVLRAFWRYVEQQEPGSFNPSACYTSFIACRHRESGKCRRF